jgi:hypothetical protein
MKNTFIILLSVSLLFGCSNKHADHGQRDQAPSATPAIDRVKVGEDVAWSDGYVLRVARRDGASLGGIRITYKGPDGQVTTTTADKGTASSSGAIERHGVKYTNFVTIVLENARAQRADGTVQEYKQAKFLLLP